MDVRAFSTPQLAIVLKVLDDYVKRDEARQLLAKRIAWGRWIDNLFLAVGKGAEQANSTQNQTQKSVSFNDVVSIFRNSTRSKRSETEIQTIKRFLVENVTSIPWKELKEEDKYALANEIDWQPIVGRSIVFLQGDFGNVYYMIGAGTVGLYLEKSEDKQMQIAKEFGDYRQKEFPGGDDDLARLGHNIANLPAGIGFGEVAILSDNHKYRSCAAVSMDRATLLLVVHATTYNKTLRKVHARQQQMSGAMELLMSLPSFSGFNYATIATLAFELNRIRKAEGSIIQAARCPVKSVYIITSGRVKQVLPVDKPNDEDDDGEQSPRMSPRIPQLGVVTLGRGKIIGEVEVYKGLTQYRHDYVSIGVSELFEVPVEVFVKTLEDQKKQLKALKASGNWDPSMAPKQSYRALQEANILREKHHENRVRSALQAASDLMGGKRMAEMVQLARLNDMLPTLLGSEGEKLRSSENATIAGNTSAAARDVSTSNGDNPMTKTMMMAKTTTTVPYRSSPSKGATTTNNKNTKHRPDANASPKSPGRSTTHDKFAFMSPASGGSRAHGGSPLAATLTSPASYAAINQLLPGAQTTGDISQRLKLAMQGTGNGSGMGNRENYPTLASSFNQFSHHSHSVQSPAQPSGPKPSAAMSSPARR